MTNLLQAVWPFTRFETICPLRSTPLVIVWILCSNAHRNSQRVFLTECPSTTFTIDRISDQIQTKRRRWHAMYRNKKRAYTNSTKNFDCESDLGCPLLD